MTTLDTEREALLAQIRTLVDRENDEYEREVEAACGRIQVALASLNLPPGCWTVKMTERLEVEAVTSKRRQRSRARRGKQVVRPPRQPFEVLDGGKAK